MHDRLTTEDQPAASVLVDRHGAPLVAEDDACPIDEWTAWRQSYAYGVNLPLNIGVFDLEMADGSRFKIEVDYRHVPAVKAWIAEHPGAPIADLVAYCDALDEALEQAMDNAAREECDL